ncbi:M23 family metallopeptidase [Brevundimonas sp. LM2]|uniref:M23 family metallopeptidase n=1 Tax=Brevundimonas sp. LM2 TaxID=1938605 RepID=UPI00098734AD|nr:M23 family metallopeptidase [Brevundimonas sp. LM2]
MRKLGLALALLLTACSPNGCASGGPEPTPKNDDPVAPAGDPVPEPVPEPPAPETTPVTWPHEPAGALVPGSGTGATDPTIWAPGMRFPMEAAPAYANSQVYGYGGFAAPGPGPGGQCDARNYAYPWRDNFCETRGWTNTMCPTGKGHQGQDIRPSTCVKKVHGVVAAEAGVVTSIGSYSVFIRGDSGRIYRYLHMDPAHVQTILTEGQRVTRGQPIGKVSDAFGGSATTIHLHFEIKAPVTANGSSAVIFVPTYTSLEDSYQKLLNATA